MIKGRGDWGHALHSVSGTPTDAVGFEDGRVLEDAFCQTDIGGQRPWSTKVMHER
jgi:hypothetical protein